MNNKRGKKNLTIPGNTPLPASNISQQLFNAQLPQCMKPNVQQPECCANEDILNSFYKKTPVNLWNTASNFQGGPPFNQCTDDALFQQCMLSQYYNYLSGNNKLN